MPDRMSNRMSEYKTDKMSEDMIEIYIYHGTDHLFLLATSYLNSQATLSNRAVPCDTRKSLTQESAQTHSSIRSRQDLTYLT